MSGNFLRYLLFISVRLDARPIVFRFPGRLWKVSWHNTPLYYLLHPKMLHPRKQDQHSIGRSVCPLAVLSRVNLFCPRHEPDRNLRDGVATLIQIPDYVKSGMFVPGGNLN